MLLRFISIESNVNSVLNKMRGWLYGNIHQCHLNDSFISQPLLRYDLSSLLTGWKFTLFAVNGKQTMVYFSWPDSFVAFDRGL